jgi:DNA-binding SARP family transcriptional activator/tetratricopeptide (TPR) repeat protein
MRVRLLGPVDVVADGETRAVSGVRRKAVLATLALHDREVVSVSRLVDVVWGEAAPATATNTLQSHVSYLRGVLGNKAAIRAHPPGYVFDLGAESTDVQLAERLLRQGTRSADPVHGVRQLEAALALWRGPALADLADLDGLEDQARRLDLLCLQVKRALSEARLAAGEHMQLVPGLEQMAAEHPLDERIHAQLMLALYRSGRQADALAVYRRLRHTLGDQLGIDPSQPLRELETAILQQDPSLDAPMAPDEPPAAITLSVPPVPVAPVPAQLPAAVLAFAGRGAELDGLDAILPGTTRAPVAVISGTAGVGKTALAVYWARRVAARFPDGQLCVDLRGFDPARAPLDPGEVLRGFLDALGVHAHRIPRGFDAQLGLYRSVLASKRVLVLLDNARDAEQVRPLLPGSPGCATVVTSRTQLTPLVATQGALPLNLGLLTPEESRDLLGRRLGASRVAAELEAAEQIIARCTGLPLALAIVAARAETTAMPLSALAEQLQDSAGTLDTLTAGDQSTDLRAVFSWSANALTPHAAGLYRLLGLHPGPDLATAAAASLTGKPVERIRSWLGELVRASLLTEHTPGRFTSHDLLRAYAAEQARTRCTDHDQHAANHRLLDHYLHSAQEAARLLYGPWNHVSLTSAQPGVITERFTGEPQAAAWLDAEYQVLLGSIEYAATAGFGTHAWRLAFSMGTYFERSGHWRDWARAARVALMAAQDTGDSSGQAHARQQLGYALTYLGDYEQAYTELHTAIDLFRLLGDDAHRALVHLSLGYLCDCQGADEQALGHSQQALELFRSAGHHAGEAVALSNIGWSQAQQADYAEAFRHCRQALHLFQEAEDRQGQAAAWDGLGYIHDCRAEHAEAIACYRKGADFFRQIRDSYNQAITLTRLGDVYHAAGDHGAAQSTWQQALRLHEALDHPDTAQLRGRLAEAGEAHVNGRLGSPSDLGNSRAWVSEGTVSPRIKYFSGLLKPSGA